MNKSVIASALAVAGVMASQVGCEKEMAKSQDAAKAPEVKTEIVAKTETAPVKDVIKSADTVVKDTVAKTETAAKDAAVKTEVAAKKAAKPVDKWAFLPEVVATVGSVEIKKDALIKQLMQQLGPQSAQISQFPENMLQNFANRAVTQMVDTELLALVAAEGGFKPSADLLPKVTELLKKQMDEQKSQFNAMPESQKKSILENIKRSGMASMDEAMQKQYEGMITEFTKRAADAAFQKTMAVQLWVDKNVLSAVSVDDAQAESFYNENKERYSTKETVTASHILITPEGADARAGKEATPEAKAAAKTKIEGLLKKLNDGADFAELAKAESSCPSKSKGGDLGSFGRGQMVGPFETAAFGMKVGETSGVVETMFGYHIIKVTDKAAGSLKKLADVKESIKNELKQTKVNDKIKKVIDKQREKSKVEVKFQVQAG